MLARSARLALQTTRRVATTAAAPAARRQFASTSSALAGENISLNWSLVEDEITPMGNAFRNLSLSGLVHHASGSKGPNKSIVVAPGQQPVGEQSSDVEDVVDALSNVDDLFVVDAAVGSYRGSEVLVRAVTDSANVALFLQHLLVGIGGSSNEKGGAEHPIKVFHSSEGQPSVTATVGEASAVIVATGDIAFDAIQESITQVTHELMATGEDEFSVLPLPGVAFTDKSGDTVVEIDVKRSSGSPIGKPPKGGSLYGAHGTVWSDAGLARLFGGAVIESKAAKSLSKPGSGDVVVGDAVVTSFRADNLVAHPSKIVFVGGKGSAKDFAKVARSDAEVAKFEALVSKHKVKISSR